MPNGGVEKVGVELVVEGADKFIGDLTKAQQAVGGLGGPAVSGATSAISGIGAAGVAAAAGPIALGVAVAGAAVKIGETLVRAIGNAVNSMRQFAVEGVMLAGRFQEMEFSALAVGRAMGLQEQEIRDAISAVQDAGIRYDAAATTVAQFARNQIDLASATELATLAQATGIMIGEDSSATMERLTLAIATGSTARLRALGIIFDNQDALEAEAATLGKSVEALTQAEKAQARVNAIVEAGKPLLDVYGAAMESPTKAMRSLAGRVIPELQASFGQFFLPALMTVVSAIKNFVETLTAATEEGGALRPILINLGAAASIAADAFAGFLSIFTDMLTVVEQTPGEFGEMSVGIAQEMANVTTAVGNETAGVIETLSQWAADAFEWGIEFVASLAEGIVEGASTVLIAAMNAIGSVLTSWLGPGSPPMVAPGLTDWGVAAMTEWLKGFTEADFGILKGIQGPLQQVLSAVDFAAVSQQLTEALAMGGGAPDESFFNIIAQSAGEFGTEIAELARLQHGLAGANAAVEESERKLEAARNAQRGAQADVGRLTREYNELLREGASPEVLATKMAELEAAEERVGVTAQQAQEAEAENQAAQDQQLTLEEQLALQKQLVDQLLLVAKAQQQTAAETEGTEEKIKKLKGEMQKIPGAMPTAAQFDIASRIGVAIDEAKRKLKQKLATLFKPLLDAWANIQETLGTLGETFETFKEIVSKAWEEIQDRITPIIDGLQLWLEINLPRAINTAKRALNVLKRAFIAVRNYIATYVIPLLRALKNVYLAGIDSISRTIANTWHNILLPALVAVRDWIKDKLIPIFSGTVEGSLGSVLAWFIESILKPLRVGLERVTYWFGVLHRIAKKVKDLLSGINIPSGLMPSSPPPFAQGLMAVAQAARQLSAVELPRLTASLGGLRAIPFAAMPTSLAGGGAQEITTTNTINMDVGPNTLQTPLDVDMLAIAVEQRLMRSMRI